MAVARAAPCGLDGDRPAGGDRGFTRACAGLTAQERLSFLREECRPPSGRQGKKVVTTLLSPDDRGALARRPSARSAHRGGRSGVPGPCHRGDRMTPASSPPCRHDCIGEYARRPAGPAQDRSPGRAAGESLPAPTAITAARASPPEKVSPDALPVPAGSCAVLNTAAAPPPRQPADEIADRPAKTPPPMPASRTPHPRTKPDGVGSMEGRGDSACDPANRAPAPGIVARMGGDCQGQAPVRRTRARSR